MALFDALLKKVRYTGDAVTAIGEAANTKGAGINLDTDPLAAWAEKISGIDTGGSTLGINFKGVQVSTNTVRLGNIPFLPTLTFPGSSVAVSGTWRFNEVLTNPSGLFVGSGRTSFTSNGNSFIGLTHAYLSSDVNHEEATIFGYAEDENTVIDVYVWNDPDNPLATGWVNGAYRTIEFTGDFPTMDAALYAWFVANATKID